jgi:hypothetical protein
VIYTTQGDVKDETFYACVFWLRAVVSSSPNIGAVGPPLIACPRLLTQYIRISRPSLPPATWRPTQNVLSRNPQISCTLWMWTVPDESKQFVLKPCFTAAPYLIPLCGVVFVCLSVCLSVCRLQVAWLNILYAFLVFSARVLFVSGLRISAESFLSLSYRCS